MSELIEFTEIVERIPVEGVYVLYEVEVAAEWASGGGDGINEPAYPGEWQISATVASATVETPEGAFQYERGDEVLHSFVVAPGVSLELTSTEREGFEVLAEELS